MGFLLFLLIGLTQAQQNQLGSDVPPDFPRLGFAINPLYDSVGIRFGHALNVRRHRPVLQTFEGDFMLGFGTGPEQVVDRTCLQNRGTREQCFLFDNPWRFSTLDNGLFQQIQDFKDKPILLYYINYFFEPAHLLMHTTNKVMMVFPVQADLQIERSFRIGSWQALHPEAGVITGRVVQASVENPLRKTYEIIIQEQKNANNFRAMSVNSGRLFRYITQAMLTGRQLRIEYVRLWQWHADVLSFLLAYATDFRIISVEILDQEPAPQA